MHARAQASNRKVKANRASHGPRVSPHSQAKARVKKIMKNPTENAKEPKGLTQGQKHPKKWSRARKFRDLHRHVPLTLPGTIVGMVMHGTMAGVLMNGMMTGVLLHGTKVGNKRNDTSASSFSRGGFDVSATSGPKRFD